MSGRKHGYHNKHRENEMFFEVDPESEEVVSVRGKKKKYKFVRPKNRRKSLKKLESQLQELFPKIDSSVVKMILSEAEGNFEKAFESLLELSPDSKEIISQAESVQNLHEPEANAEEVKQKAEPMVDIEDLVPDNITKEELIQEVAIDLVEQYPRFPIDKVKELLNKHDFDILEVTSKLIEEYGAEPFSEKELILQNKKAMLDYYLDGQQPTKEFLDFYYNNDLQEREMSKVMNNLEESKAKKEVEDSSCSHDEVYYHFPLLDELIVRYVLSFYSHLQTIDYLRKLYPDKFIEKPSLPEAKANSKKFKKPKKMKDFKELPQGPKNPKRPGGRFVYIDGMPLSNILDNKYREIRDLPKVHKRLHRLYESKRAKAEAKGDFKAAEGYRQIADEAKAKYEESSKQAAVQIIDEV
eukprot:TRINITY_DN12983_c0_g4_i2.p1 TRINITY_DN12983_c0_g4~~TRINITY_DN12983_c0_g4_i2.p1  ORF type:complete len:411 (-),score=108.34 TRINITY_DN12983_c0_g4_i2:490-1722(-)